MSARVIRLPTAMTPQEWQARRELIAEMVRLLNEREAKRLARVEAKKLQEMVVPFPRPRRRRAKPTPPSGPRPAA